MADTSQYPVVARTIIILMAFAHWFVISAHSVSSAGANSYRREMANIWICFYCLMTSISYFITFPEIENRYTTPVLHEGYYRGETIQDLRTARIAIQLIANTFLYHSISLILSERLHVVGLAKARKWGSWMDGFVIIAIFITGMISAVLNCSNYQAFNRGELDPLIYLHRLVLARQMKFAWVLCTGIFTFNMILRAAVHLKSTRKLDIDDQVSKRVLFLIAPMLLVYTITIILVNCVLPDYLGITIGELTGRPLTLQQLNDPTSTDSNIEFLEVIAQLGVAGEQFFIVISLVWLLSDSARHHWYVGTFQDL